MVRFLSHARTLAIFSLLATLPVGLSLAQEAAPQHVEVGAQKHAPCAAKALKADAARKATDIASKGAMGQYWHIGEPLILQNVGPDGESIVTSDETVWLIAPSSRRTAKAWRNFLLAGGPACERTPVTITPSRWYSPYDYYLINERTKQKVCAKLSQGPLLSHANFIEQIDTYAGLLRVSVRVNEAVVCDSYWHVVPNADFCQWKVGQVVLIGKNTSWFGAKHILVNVNENNYVPADLAN